MAIKGIHDEHGYAGGTPDPYWIHEATFTNHWLADVWPETKRTLEHDARSRARRAGMELVGDPEVSFAVNPEILDTPVVTLVWR